MKRLYLAGPGGGGAPAAQWRGGRDEEFELAPRPDYEVFVVDVPPVRGERLDAALPYRVRALYPGPTESTVLDHRPLIGFPGRRLVFLADRENLAALKDSAGKRPLAAGALLLSAVPSRGPWTGVLWTSAWAEVFRFEGSALLSSRLLSRAGDPIRAAESLPEALKAEADGNPVLAAYTRDAESEREALSAALSGWEGGFRVSPLEDLVPRPTEESCAVFRERRAIPVLGARVLSRALAALALVLAAAVPIRTARIRGAELAARKTEYEAAKARSSAVLEKAAELDRLAARREELEAADGPEAYRLLADLAAAAGPEVRVRSITLEGGSFRLEAEGSDGLTVLKRLRESGRFSSVELRQSVVLPGKGERYTLSGKGAER